MATEDSIVNRIRLNIRQLRTDRFSFRGVHPMFHDSDMYLRATQSQNGLDMCTVAEAGHMGMQAKAEWED